MQWGHTRLYPRLLLLILNKLLQLALVVVVHAVDQLVDVGGQLAVHVHCRGSSSFISSEIGGGW